MVNPRAGGQHDASGRSGRQGQQPTSKQLQELRRLLKLCERERGLIANELHDGCVQDMVAAHMFLEVALDSLPRRSAARPHVEQAYERIGAALNEARRIIAGIRLPTLDQGGLKFALEQLVTDPRFNRLTVHLDVQVERQRFLPTVELAVYRIVQEALTNAATHGDARNAWVSVVERSGQLHIEVRDDGVGFDPQQVPASRFGLSGMKQRATLLGGKFQVQSAPGKGTLIQSVIPIRDALLE